MTRLTAVVCLGWGFFFSSSFFFWIHRQGEDSSQIEKGASSILATQLDEELGGGAVQVTDDWLTITCCHYGFIPTSIIGIN